MRFFGRHQLALLAILQILSVLVRGDEVLVNLGANMDNLSGVHREILSNIDSMMLPAAPSAKFDISSFTPFCNNFSLPEDIRSINAECLRWEEHELDMLLMYIDLIMVGMDETLARTFYGEIRCLSRANIQPITYLNAWQVCFTYDYSELIGNLLAKYIHEDIKLTNPTLRPPSSRISTSLPTASRFLYGHTTSGYTTSFLFNVFHSHTSLRAYDSYTTLTSCCKRCANTNYFVNLGYNDCQYDPFGKHCCHLACKSLSHLKIGASTSIDYCCHRSSPQTCLRY